VSHEARVVGRARRPSRVPSLRFGTLKRLSFAHSTVYAILLVVWLVPGLHALEFVFGLAHGLGWIAMCLLSIAAVRARVITLRVGVAGIARSFVSHEGERKEPNAYWPTPATAELGTSDSSTALPVSS